MSLQKILKNVICLSLIIILFGIGALFYQMQQGFQSQVNQFQIANSDMKSQINNLEFQLSAASNVSENLQTYADILEGQLNSSNSASQELEAQMATLQNQVAESEIASNAFENQINRLQNQISSSATMSQTLQNQITNLENQLSASEELTQTLQNQIDALQAQIEGISDAILSATPVSTFELVHNFTMDSHTSNFFQFPSDKYRTVTLVVYVIEPVIETTEIKVFVNFWAKGSDSAPIVDEFIVNRAHNATVVKTYDVISSYFGFAVTNPTDTEVYAKFTVYMSS